MFIDENARINGIVNYGANTAMTDIEFIERELVKFKNSSNRFNIITGEMYYRGEHDIKRRRRKAIGVGGELTEIKNLPNNRLIDNQYAKMVDQKVNYLLSKPITFKGENTAYMSELKSIFGKSFMRILKNIGEDSLNGGIGWLYIYCDENGRLSFKRFMPSEILPFWKDSEHTELDMVVRIYELEAYEGKQESIVEKVEIYTEGGISRYDFIDNRLIPDITEGNSSYILDCQNNAYSWGKIPIIAFKQNNKEIPLIKRVKSLQDALNTVRSDFMNNMQEDSRNTILVIKNYDGTNLGEFRRNLSEYGAVKVKSIDGADGGVEALRVEVNSTNYIVLCDMLKKAIVENARGYDARDERMSNNPNQMNIQSMYSDIDLDANGMELEFQASFEQLFYFVNMHLANTGKGDFDGEEVKVIFNRDVLINETDAISNCRASLDIISNETIIEQHPWIDDVQAELKRVKKQKQI